MTTLEDIEGRLIVGYRYGVAPECGYSYNTADQEYECGVSMAKVGFDEEINSFAADAQSECAGRYYYVGKIAGKGSDGEICLTDVVEISEEEYIKMLPSVREVSNAVVNYRADGWLSLINRGYIIAKNEEQIEEYRRNYIK